MADVRFRVVFFRTEAGTEPVRDWLKELNREDRRVIGEDIKTVQFGWPLGMPLVRKLDPELWEVRSQLHQRIARVIFTVQHDLIVLLHSFIKKSQKTPISDLNVARKRLAQFREHAP
jgi:phage-related protein